MILGGSVIHFRFGVRDTQLATVAHRIGLLGGSDQSLRWDTTIIQAITAHLMTFKQDHLGAHLNGASCDGQPTRATADDADICLNPVHSLRFFLAADGFDHNRHRGKRTKTEDGEEDGRFKNDT